MNILLHTCCAPCAIFPLIKLTEEKINSTLFFFNPNIHPYREYKKRITTLQKYADQNKINLHIKGKYGLTDFLREVVYNEKNRCQICYRLRFEQTAKYAVENNYNAFTSTLLYSKYQKHDMIKDTGIEMSRKYGIHFLYYDFRTGWQKGVDAAIQADLYRQPYCGCVYSEQDRYDKKGRL